MCSGCLPVGARRNEVADGEHVTNPSTGTETQAYCRADSARSRIQEKLLNVLMMMMMMMMHQREDARQHGQCVADCVYRTPSLFNRSRSGMPPSMLGRLPGLLWNVATASDDQLHVCAAHEAPKGPQAALINVKVPFSVAVWLWCVCLGTAGGHFWWAFPSLSDSSSTASLSTRAETNLYHISKRSFCEVSCPAHASVFTSQIVSTTACRPPRCVQRSRLRQLRVYTAHNLIV